MIQKFIKPYLLSVNRHSLWLADDHVLSITNHFFTESYKRFYFKDIRSIVIEKTKRQSIFLLIFGLLFLFWVLFAVSWVWNYYDYIQAIDVRYRFSYYNTYLAWRAGFSVAVGLSLFIPFLINLIRGPTCRTFIETMAHREKIPALGRTRKALEAFSVLSRVVSLAQNAENPQWLKEKVGTSAI